MKRCFAIIFLLGCLLSIVCFGRIERKEYHTEYLRIHIRANSNLETDQNIKYIIKDKIIEYLTPFIANCNTKKSFQNMLQNKIPEIVGIANEILAQNKFDYKSSASIRNEYFPVRSYNNVTLENGYYDALIVNLGSGEGNNWWCVVYPPLCFLNSTENYTYKSRIYEVIKKFFGG